MAEAREQLHVKVRLLTEPALWCWEIRDESGRVVESSWAASWIAYPSPEEAERAGRCRLRALAAGGATTKRRVA